MKRILILTIDFYQAFISSIMKNILGVGAMCKYSPTCSEYAKQMIEKHGILGIAMGIKRIGRCI